MIYHIASLVMKRLEPSKRYLLYLADGILVFEGSVYRDFCYTPPVICCAYKQRQYRPQPEVNVDFAAIFDLPAGFSISRTRVFYHQKF